LAAYITHLLAIKLGDRGIRLINLLPKVTTYRYMATGFGVFREMLNLEMGL
jgi:hypothetical protein